MAPKMPMKKMPAKPMGAHPGFEGAARQVAAREGMPMDRARAVIAAGARKAGPAARKRNPRLNRVKGKAK